MKPRQFVVLAAAAAGSLIVAIVTYLAAVPWSAGSTGPRDPMLSVLSERGGDLAAIELVRGKESLRLDAKDGTWVLASGEGYPVDTAKVRELILAATEARLVERKTAMKDRHEFLGLTEPTEVGATARLLRLIDAKGDVMGEIVLGRAAFDAFEASKGGTYVRRPGEDQTWLADRQMQAGLSLRDWVRTRLIDVSPEKIQSIRIEIEGEPPYEIKRTADGKQHELGEMPAGKKLKYVSAVDDVAKAVSLIEFRNVRKASKADALPLKGRATFETVAGFKPTIEFRSDGSKVWAKVSATGEGGVKADVEDLTRRADGWEFELPMTELNAVLVKLADLIEETPA